MTPKDLTVLEDRLAQAIGLDSGSLGSTVFRQAVDRRMRARGVEALPAYIRLLDSDAMEFQALVEELVVKESWFFRHAHAFDLLREHAATTMTERREPYRVLSFPCAGGEEPYSIAMCLREAGLGFHQVQIEAADISETALQKARGGSYGLRSIRVVPPEIRDRYFRVTTESVEVLPEIRQAVRFAHANIVGSQSLLQGAAYDAVFCRNLLIYLTPAARQRVMQDVYRSLAPGGLFFVGHAEMLQEFETWFEPVRQRGAFAYGRRSATMPVPSESPAALSEATHPDDLNFGLVHLKVTAPTNKGRSVNLPQSEAPSVASPARNALQARSRVNPESTSQQTMDDDWVRSVTELSNASRYLEAIEACEQQLRQTGPSPQIYHLLGMVLQAAGLPVRAAQALERAVYLDPHHEEALLALALLARRRGDVQIADRFQQRSQRAHQRRLRT